MKSIKNIAVIGLGLIGGSIALALKDAVKDVHVTGFDIITDAMNIARYRNIIDLIAKDYGDAVKDADIVIIATPISRIIEVVDEIKGH